MGQSQLGDQRRTGRLADTARRSSDRPGGSSPDKLAGPACRAAPRLMSHQDATHAAVLRPHRLATLGRAARAAGTVLFLEGVTTADVFDPVAVSVSGVWRHREGRPPTVRESPLALGRRGGHRNRNCDGLPGRQTPWRGAMKPHAMIDCERSRRTSGKL